MAPKYKLTYFTIRGLGEPIRFILSYLGADFEDHRVEFSEWPQLKASSPYGKLPYLEIDGKVVCQSVAIVRYLGKQAGLNGDNDWESFMIDMAVDIVRDTMTDFVNVLRESDPEKKAKKQEELKNDIAPPQLQKLDKLIQDNGGYLANGKLSWGDIYVAAAFDFLGDKVGVDFATYPNINGLINKVLDIPSIKAWVSKRPEDKARPS